MRLKQPLFYRQTGVRIRSHLMRPRLIPMERLILPFESVYHYWPEDSATLGPTIQDPILGNLNGRVFLEHVTELDTREGNPRRTVLNPTMMSNQYRRKNRGFRPLRKDQALTINVRNVLVKNYGMLPSLYRYIPSYKVAYFRWRNMAATFWNHVADTETRFKWNQYIDLQLPERIPTLDDFRRADKSISQKTLKTFNAPALFNLLDLWRWMGENREDSLIPDVPYERLNFLIRLKGYFFVINLGVIDGWRKDENAEDDTGGLQASQLQRYFLRLLHGLRDFMSGVTTASDGEIENPADGHPPKKLDKPENTPVDPDPVDAPEDPETSGEDGGDALLLPEFDDPIVLPEPKSPTPPTFDTRFPETAEPEDGPEAVRLPNVGTDELDAEVDTPAFKDTLSEGVVTKAQELHDAGLMSAKAYERTLEEANGYTTLPNPYDATGSLTDLLSVTEEDLALPEPVPTPDTDTIPDKSMLQSKLKGLTKKYVKSVLKKDVVSSVLAVQRMGVSVKDYTVEVVQDNMSHYEMHSVTLKPVRGRQSTVRFRIPVVDDDGRFMSNGTQNRMRLQRAD